MEERAKGYQEEENMLYRIANKTGSRPEIKKIKAKSSKKRHNDISDSFSNESDYDSCLSSYSDRYEYRRPAGRR